VPPESSNYSSLDLYDTLEEEFLSIHTDEFVCFLGDFNARTKDMSDLIGADAQFLQSLDSADFIKIKLEEEKLLEDLGFDLSRYSLDPVSNNYGYRFLEMCKNIGICIVNGRLGLDRGVGSTTCDDKSLIDYVMVSPQMFPLVQGFRVEAFDRNFSDKHNPLCVTFKLVDPSLVHSIADRELNCNTQAHKRVNWSNEKCEDFKLSMNTDQIDNILSRISDLNDGILSQDDVDEAVGAIGQMFNDSGEKSGIVKQVKTKMVKRRSNVAPWFNTNCEDKRKIYFRARNKFAQTKLHSDKTEIKRLNKLYKQCIQKSKQDFRTDLNNKLRNLRSSDPKKYWDLVNGGSKREEIPITSETFQEHFKKLGHTVIDGGAEQHVFEQGCNEYNHELNSPFTASEIKKCIVKLKNNKAYGLDCILNEYLKCSSDLMLPIYEKLFNIILSTGFIPNSWLTGVIKPLYKNKGDKEDVDNYRGITILSCLGKLFTAVINERLTLHLKNNEVIGEEQAGFRKGYSTMDHVFTLKSLLDLYLSKKKRLYCCFVDYKKAFDLVDRVLLWKKLISCDVNGNLFRVIFNLYKGAKSDMLCQIFSVAL
jgi:hypothetical protein